ncbi:hypothetical protein ACLOJK_034840, partial [Asimina triloba]
TNQVFGVVATPESGAWPSGGGNTSSSWVGSLHETGMEWEMSPNPGQGRETPGPGEWPFGGGCSPGS